MARKRKAAQASEAPRQRRLNVSLDAELCGRLAAYASWRGETIGAVVSRAVAHELAKVRFTVYCAPGRSADDPSPALSDGTGIAPGGPEEVGVAQAGKPSGVALTRS